MNYIKRNSIALIGIGLGALCGYLYYYFVGCVSGSCAIISNPINSTVYGAILGGLVVNLFKKDKVKTL